MDAEVAEPRDKFAVYALRFESPEADFAEALAHFEADELNEAVAAAEEVSALLAAAHDRGIQEIWQEAVEDTDEEAEFAKTVWMIEGGAFVFILLVWFLTKRMVRKRRRKRRRERALTAPAAGAFRPPPVPSEEISER